MNRFRDAKVCKNLVTDEIGDHRIQSALQVHNWTTKIQKERTLHLVLLMRGETERQDARHQWQRDHQDPGHLPHSAHEPQHVNWCTSPVVRLRSSWSVHHIVAQVVRVSHVIHACSERHSSTLSSPFHPTSSTSHSPSISCSPSCSLAVPLAQSSTTLRTVVTLRTGAYDESYLSTGYEAQELRPHGDLCRVPHRVPDPATVLQARVPRGRGLRWHRAWGDASRSTPSTCLSLPARRLVCRPVVVVRVRANLATCWRANGATCCGKWSGAERWTRTD